MSSGSENSDLSSEDTDDDDDDDGSEVKDNDYDSSGKDSDTDDNTNGNNDDEEQNSVDRKGDIPIKLGLPDHLKEYSRNIVLTLNFTHVIPL